MKHSGSSYEHHNRTIVQVLIQPKAVRSLSHDQFRNILALLLIEKVVESICFL